MKRSMFEIPLPPKALLCRCSDSYEPESARKEFFNGPDTFERKWLWELEESLIASVFGRKWRHGSVFSTICLTTPLLRFNAASPRYKASILWYPAGSEEVEYVAMPPDSVTVASFFLPLPS